MKFIKKFQKRNLLFLLGIAFFLGSCGKGEDNINLLKDSTEVEAKHDDHGHKEGEHSEGEHTEGEKEHEEPLSITVTPKAITESGITEMIVKRQRVFQSVSAPGRVIPSQNGIAHIGTIIPGRVSRILKTEGSRVSKGTVVAELQSYDVGEIKAEYLNSQVEVDQTKRTLERRERLTTEGIGSKQTLEEARAAYDKVSTRLKAAESRLRAVGISPSAIGESDFSASIQIRSPISGVISKQSVVNGEYVEPNKDMFEVVNVSTLWVEAQVPPELTIHLKVGNNADVRVQGGTKVIGKIIYIAPMVDAVTRTVPVRISIANTNGLLKPQSFVTVYFEGSKDVDALVIPRLAVEEDGSHFFVYKVEKEGIFTRTEISLGDVVSNGVVVSNGLSEGDRIAQTGIFYLKSLRQKGELQEHEH